MLGWSIIFIVLAITTGFIGFGGPWEPLGLWARMAFFFFLVLTAASLMLSIRRRR